MLRRIVFLGEFKVAQRWRNGFCVEYKVSQCCLSIEVSLLPCTFSSLLLSNPPHGNYCLQVKFIMSTAIKPLTLWGGVLGPNPAKVSMILYSLDIPHEVIYVPYKEIKNPEYLKVNPNGRLPTIEDPNTGIRLWESGAIIDYLIEKYDKNFEISYEPGTEEYYLCKQWLHFQMSGQGPYYGQAVWFINLHPEKLQSCIDRYVNEIKRVSSVLNTHLSTNQWLVGNKCTYADLAFIPWQEFSTKVVAPYYDAKEEFPHVQRWLDEMVAMEPIKRVLEEKERKNLEVFGKKDEDKDAEKEEHK